MAVSVSQSTVRTLHASSATSNVGRFDPGANANAVGDASPPAARPPSATSLVASVLIPSSAVERATSYRTNRPSAPHDASSTLPSSVARSANPRTSSCARCFPMNSNARDGSVPSGGSRTGPRSRKTPTHPPASATGAAHLTRGVVRRHDPSHRVIGESHRLHLRERARVECFEVPTVGADYEALAVRAIPRGAGELDGAAPAASSRRDDALGVESHVQTKPPEPTQHSTGSFGCASAAMTASCVPSTSVSAVRIASAAPASSNVAARNATTLDRSVPTTKSGSRRNPHQHLLAVSPRVLVEPPEPLAPESARAREGHGRHPARVEAVEPRRQPEFAVEKANVKGRRAPADEVRRAHARDAAPHDAEVRHRGVVHAQNFDGAPVPGTHPGRGESRQAPGRDAPGIPHDGRRRPRPQSRTSRDRRPPPEPPRTRSA